MKPFHLTISTPNGHLFSGDCVKLDVRGVEGSLAVRAGHIPFVTSVVKGECSVLLEDGTDLEGAVDGGILSVAPDGNVTLIAGSARFLDDSNAEVKW